MPSVPGKVFLVGAGPGDRELLTTKAVRLLQSAGVVLHDSLVSAEVLALVSPTAERIDVGKRRGIRLLSQDDINSLLVAAAAKHQVVVRLKGGDPLLFGRAAEEIEQQVTIPIEIVMNGLPHLSHLRHSRKGYSLVVGNVFRQSPSSGRNPAAEITLAQEGHHQSASVACACIIDDRFEAIAHFRPILSIVWCNQKERTSIVFLGANPQVLIQVVCIRLN